MVTYGYCVAWTSRDGGTESVSVEGCTTPEDARRQAMEAAIGLGWTAPRFWQWWRWNDRPRQSGLAT